MLSLTEQLLARDVCYETIFCRKQLECIPEKKKQELREAVNGSEDD